jgi:hypothetical protein
MVEYFDAVEPMDLESFIPEPLIYLTGYFLAVVAGHFIVKAILSRFPLRSESGDVEELKHAGMVIGILERIFTLTFVLIDEYTAIALIFTAKSIARFEELKQRRFSEYYLIGTLTSILVALIVGMLTRWLLELF